MTSLIGKKILIVEDDTALAERLRNELIKKDAESISMAYCIQDAVDILKDNSDDFEAIILDVMLPENQESFKAVKLIKDELIKIRAILTRAHAASNPQLLETEEVKEAREKRKNLLEQIDQLIIRDGGIQIIERVIAYKRVQKFSRPPILFLTAVGSFDAIERATILVSTMRWLVKPQPISIIVENLCQLMAHKDEPNG